MYLAPAELCCAASGFNSSAVWGAPTTTTVTTTITPTTHTTTTTATTTKTTHAPTLPAAAVACSLNHLSCLY